MRFQLIHHLLPLSSPKRTTGNWEHSFHGGTSGNDCLRARVSSILVGKLQAETNGCIFGLTSSYVHVNSLWTLASLQSEALVSSFSGLFECHPAGEAY